MGRMYLVVIFIICMSSCNDTSKKNKDKGYPEPAKDVARIEYAQIGESDSIKLTLHYALSLDTIESSMVEERLIIFYFTFDSISAQELENFAFIMDYDSDKYKKTIKEKRMSRVLVNPDSTAKTFYVLIGEAGHYHLTGMIDDNLFIKGKDKVRKIGTYITKDIKVK